MTDDQNRITELAQWLAAVLTEGISLSQSVQDFMEGTFGSADLEQIIETADSSELDSLLELLFYPDLSLKLRFETRWGNQSFTQDELQEIVELVSDAAVTANILNAAGQPDIALSLPSFVITAFIERINLIWQPPAALKTCLSKLVQHKHSIRIRVHLRHARLDWHPNQVDLIDRYLSHMPREADHFESSLLFLLELMAELPQESGHFEFLTAKKFFFFQALCKAEDFERRRQASNMEIMMLQGNRSAHGNIDEWRLRMRLVDGICNALFGRTQFFQQPTSRSVDLGQGETEQKIDEVIRKLS